MKPLEGVRILDVSRMVAGGIGPQCHNARQHDEAARGDPPGKHSSRPVRA